MKSKSTIYDISKLANVSIATVSRVVNDDDSVRESTREKVKEAMNLLRYRPSQSAKFMGEKRDTISVGVLYRFASSGFFTELLKGIDQALSQKDCLMMASRLKEEHMTEEIKNYIKQSGIQALILLFPEWNDDLIAFLKQTILPIVVIGEPCSDPEVYQVNSDNENGIGQIVEKLIEKHSRETLVLHGPSTNKEAQVRLKKTVEVLKAHQLDESQIHLIDGEFQPKIAVKKLEKWLNDHPAKRSFNLVCHTDSMALNALSLLKESGFSIPEDVALVGHDDIEFSDVFNLSTVKVNFEALGEKAAQIALGLLRYEDVEKQATVPTEVILRKSF